MKHTATLLIVASLLASASAIAGNGISGRSYADRVENDRGHENRGNDNRGHDNRGNDHHGHDNRGDNQHDRGNHAPPVVAHRDNDRHDWNDHRNDRPDNNRHDWNDRRDDRPGNDRWDHYRSDWNNHPHYNDNRSYDRRDYARYRYNYGFYQPPRGYSNRVWHRGDRLPVSYYDRSYVVYDWRPYRLYEPPYGYHWVRVGSDVVLSAIATGVVLDVLYNIWN